MERGGQSFFYNADGLGSITELTNATGEVIKAYIYDSFGNVISFGGVAEETGLRLNRHGQKYRRQQYYKQRNLSYDHDNSF